MDKIDILVAAVVAGLELNKGLLRQKAVESWPEDAGSELSSFSRPLGFNKSVLLIQALHPAASMEITLRKRELLQKINHTAGVELFKEIRIVRRL